MFTKKPDGSNLSVCRCSGITIGRPRPGAINCCLFDASHTPLRKLLYSATLMSDPEKLKHLNLFYPKACLEDLHFVQSVIFVDVCSGEKWLLLVLTRLLKSIYTSINFLPISVHLFI